MTGSTDIAMIIQALHNFNNNIYPQQAETLFSELIMNLKHLNQAVNGPVALGQSGVKTDKQMLLFELNKIYNVLGSKGGMQSNAPRFIAELRDMQKHVGDLTPIIGKLDALPKLGANVANAVVPAPAVITYAAPGKNVPLNLSDGPTQAVHKQNSDRKTPKKPCEVENPYPGPLGDFRKPPF